MRKNRLVAFRMHVPINHCSTSWKNFFMNCDIVSLPQFFAFHFPTSSNMDMTTLWRSVSLETLHSSRYLKKISYLWWDNLLIYLLIFFLKSLENVSITNMVMIWISEVISKKYSQLFLVALLYGLPLYIHSCENLMYAYICLNYKLETLIHLHKLHWNS
jgi:hypothetical protein